MNSRHVTIVSAPGSENSTSETVPFDSVLKHPNLILIGDPGAGKSHMFRLASAKEGADLYTARTFSIYGESGSGNTIYIDALDETRSMTDSPSSVDDIVRIIVKRRPSRVRISCRAADWLGETDLGLFRPYFNATGGHCIVAIRPLATDEVIEILKEKGVVDPEEFVQAAERRGVGPLLGNPQTLLMLIDAVRDGQWPASKRELYELATQILLKEHNTSRATPKLGVKTETDLLAAAGAICAMALISNVEGLCLDASRSNDLYPHFQSIPFEDNQALFAALTRRVFQSTDEDSVTFVHRTIAEYLAAIWIGGLVRSGLPIGRVLSLISVDGDPAIELRGLHAWLTVVLHEYADQLIHSDPYGVLSYGDVASLAPQHRKVLLNSLVDLSVTDPWFRSYDWQAEHFGALSGHDMIPGFKQIIESPTANFHLKSLVLDAISNGPECQPLTNTLVRLLCNDKASYGERHGAFHAILNADPDGAGIIVDATMNTLAGDPGSARLRCAIAAEIYENNFGPEDVSRIVRDYLSLDERQAVGDLWLLRRSLPIDDLPSILDRVSALAPTERHPKRQDNSFEVESFFDGLVERLLDTGYQPSAQRLWTWLVARHQFHGGAGGYARESKLREWLTEHPDVLKEIFVAQLGSFTGDSIHRFWYDFCSISLGSVDRRDLIHTAYSTIRAKKDLCDRDQKVFELVLSLTVNSDPPETKLFDELCDFGSKFQRLQQALASLTVCEIEDWRHEQRVNRAERDANIEKGREDNRANFEKRKNEIQAGKDLGWLGWLAQVYRAGFGDVERELAPRQRLEKEIGANNAELAIRGFVSLLKVEKAPTPTEIARLHVKGKYYWWWLALVAGLDEHWIEHGNTDEIDEDVLCAGLAVNVLHPTFDREDGTETRVLRDWREALINGRPDLADNTYVEIARVELQSRSQHASSIFALLDQDSRTLNASDRALELLREFPAAQPTNLRQMILNVICSSPHRKELLALSREVTAQRSRVVKEQRAIWLSVWFLLDFDSFGATQRRYLQRNDHAIWTLKSIQESALESYNAKDLGMLSTEQITCLIGLFARRFENVDFPSRGWSGSTNPWDGAEYIRKLVNELSTRTDSESVSGLKKLLANQDLATFVDQIRHALASQSVLRRQSMFRQPSWQEAGETLSGGRPANVPDLHALAMSHLRQVATAIRGGNTDTYKAFWNEDSYGRLCEPKIEDSCRDRLIELLRPLLVPVDVRVEPEGHMVFDKRADIVLMPPPGTKLPIELKRDCHTDVWTACTNQLDRLYTRDPESAGYGIYGVFWFGPNSVHKIQRPPAGQETPDTPMDMEHQLRALIPPKDRNRLDVVVIDVSK